MNSDASTVRLAGQRICASGIPFGLTVLFLIALYSQVALQVPVLEVARPVYAIGGLAIFTLLVERMLARRGLELVWPESYLLLAFVGAAALSCIGALWPGYAAQNTLELLKPVALYFLLLHTVDSEQRLHIVLWTIVLGALFPTLGTLRNYFDGNLIEGGRAAWVGIFKNPNELAYSLVVLVPLVIYLVSTCRFWRTVPLWIMLGLYTAAIYVSFSRGGILGLLAVALLLGLRWRSVPVRSLTLVLLAISAVFMVYGWTRGAGFTELGLDASFQQRLATIRAGLAMFADHPVTGVGLGCSVVAWPLYTPPEFSPGKWLVIHNTFIQALSETGILGFLNFTLLIGVALYRARSIAQSAAGRDLRAARLGLALEIALWGFIVCGLSGGYVLTWFPYILTALVASAEKVGGNASPEK